MPLCMAVRARVYQRRCRKAYKATGVTLAAYAATVRLNPLTSSPNTTQHHATLSLCVCSVRSCASGSSSSASCSCSCTSSSKRSEHRFGTATLADPTTANAAAILAG
eukprot:643591-Rhodomonas_salina.1